MQRRPLARDSGGVYTPLETYGKDPSDAPVWRIWVVMLYCAAMVKMDPATIELRDLIKKYRAESWALLFMDAARPLVVLGSQAAYMLQPFTGAVGDRMVRFGGVLEDPTQLEQLIASLGSAEAE